MLYVMLVGAYPFERPKDEGPSKMQKMIQATLFIFLLISLFSINH